MVAGRNIMSGGLGIFEQLSDDSGKYGQAHTVNHLGLLYTRQGEWTQARQHLEQAFRLWLELGNNYGLMDSYINLSVFLIESNQLDEAKEVLDAAQVAAYQVK